MYSLRGVLFEWRVCCHPSILIICMNVRCCPQCLYFDGTQTELVSLRWRVQFLKKFSRIRFDAGNVSKLHIFIQRPWTLLSPLTHQTFFSVAGWPKNSVFEHCTAVQSCRSWIQTLFNIFFRPFSFFSISTQVTCFTAIFSLTSHLSKSSEQYCISYMLYLSWLITQSVWVAKRNLHLTRSQLTW